MLKSLIKIISLFLIFGLNWAGLSAIGSYSAYAYFNDVDNIESNIYSAGTLDFSLAGDNFYVMDFEIGSIATATINVINNGSLDFQYIASTTLDNAGGLCDDMDLLVKLNGAEQYFGALKDFLSTATTTLGQWYFEIDLPNSAFGECQFDFVFQGWQIEAENYNDSGFFDQEIINNTIVKPNNIADYLVINKVHYYNDEWVEIYNPTDEPVDISGWLIKDNYAEDIIPSADSIPALGYGIIANISADWDSWHLPDDIVKIALNSDIGNRLSDVADMLMLIDNNNNIIDQMNWGASNINWNNYNDDIWNPGIDNAKANNVLSRNPNGYDTDQVSDWTEFSLPDVTVIIPNGGEVWYIGATSTITWLAENNNGDDQELSIDIYYSIDSGNTWAQIAFSTENDGIFDWRVPLFIVTDNGLYWTASSKARVKVVATDHAKNFMITAWDISDEDFCPPIIYDLLTPEELALLEQMGMLDGSTGRSAEDNNESAGSNEADNSLIADIASSTSEFLDIAGSNASSTTEIASTTDKALIDQLANDDQAVLIVEIASSADEVLIYDFTDNLDSDKASSTINELDKQNNAEDSADVATEDQENNEDLPVLDKLLDEPIDNKEAMINIEDEEETEPEPEPEPEDDEPEPDTNQD